MVERRAGRLDLTYGALANATRREVLKMLRSGPMSVGELAEPFRISLAGVSKHVGVLEEAGLVERTASGRNRIVTLDTVPLFEAWDWLETYRSFWQDRLDALETHLARGRDESS